MSLADATKVNVLVQNPVSPFGGVTVLMPERDIQVEINPNPAAVQSVFGRTGNVVARLEDFEIFYAPLDRALPPGGLEGQIITKLSSAPNDAQWSDPPTAGLANPTALIGMSAVNGASLDAIRSDAAPAINPAIAPDWTGTHIFHASPAVPTPTLNQHAANKSYVDSAVGGGVTPAALSTADDVNVTAFLTGTPLTALLQPVGLHLGWTGTLSKARGGTAQSNQSVAAHSYFGNNTGASAAAAFNQIDYSELSGLPTLPTPAALTKTDDTNVTLVLVGTPATALLQAVQLNLGWTGTLSRTRGGLGVSGNGIAAHTYFGNNTGSSGNGAFVQPSASDLSDGITGSGSVALATSPTLVTPVIAALGNSGTNLSLNSNRITNVSDPMAAQDAATKNYVDTALSTFNEKPSVAYASTTALPANTYANGSSGVGATLTGNSNGPLIIDGVTLVIGAVGQRILVTGESIAANNGWYTLTQLGVIAVSPYILTRATESDQAAEIGAGYLTGVVAPNTLTPGSSNNGKVFISVAADPFTVGTTSLTFSQVGSTYSAGTGLSLSGSTFSIDTSITVDKTTAQVLTNKNLSSGTNTFPTLNQSTTGSAASLSISGQSALLTFLGLTSTNRAKTLRDAADTILELGGSYTPTGTWTSLTMVTPVLGTPASGNLANCTGLPIAGLTASTSTAIGVGSVELGHASDTTLSRSAAGIMAVEGIDIPPRYTIRAASIVTQANDTNPHAVFTTPANGRFTPPSTGTWHFEAVLQYSSMSGTSGNLKIDVLGAGTATCTNWSWQAWGNDNTSNPSANGGSLNTTSASPASIVSAGTGTTLGVTIRGSVEVTGLGTIIPTQTLVTAAAAVLGIGSFFTFWRAGPTGMTSVGPWD